jgi:hypothetical protein
VWSGGGSVRPLASKQQIENHTQRIDVARSGDRVATDLLGAGEIRGHDRHNSECGVVASGSVGVRVQNFGDAEIEQLGSPIFGDKNVSGLQVTVHHKILVRMLHGGTGRAKKPEAVGSVQLVEGAIFINGQAGDIFQYQVRQPFFGDSAVQQTGDVGVFQACQNLTFVSES